MPNPKSELRKCNSCYATNAEKSLHKCSRCKAAVYCSRECQKADWKRHKTTCNYNATLADALKQHENSIGGLIDRLALPDSMSMYELDQRLEKWVKFHTRSLMAACIHALKIPLDLSNSRRQVMYVKLRARDRSEHGDAVGKYFEMVDAYPVSWSEAMMKGSPWPESLVQLREMQDESERMKRGSVAAAMIECPPLAVQTVPFGSMKNLSDPSLPTTWRLMLKDIIDNGKKYPRGG